MESDNRWIIDPLDGTTNYTHSLPIFCVSIGVAQNGAVVAGAIYNPSTDEMFTAEKGEEHFSMEKKFMFHRTIRLSIVCS